ncbi:hypothetical protein IPH25_02600 [bacterium]|nr:MAG: hypothetical protein IPG37_04740 [bacterium]QQR62309.1 MAG: hypothetical protein IPH25_02600 [bacterium]QQR63124.1 MAG: hypothetical protein IPH67_01450 [bacterium]
MKRKTIFLLITSFFNPFYGMYFYQPFNDALLLSREIPDKADFSFLAAGGFTKAKQFNYDGHSVSSPFRLWYHTENTLKMLEGLSAVAPETQFLNSLNADDDGVRGHMLLDGDFRLKAAVCMSAQLRLAEQFSFLLFIPWYQTELVNIAMTDLTQSNNLGDRQVKDRLTKQISSVLSEYGNLSLTEWISQGVGDIGCYVKWENDFVQYKPFLKNVFLQIRVGLQLPTAHTVSLHRLLSHSFGNNGATGLPFGAQLKLRLGTYFLCGFDVELTHLFNRTVTQRIKTAVEQSELFLLKKSDVHIDFGMNQSVMLFGKFLYEQRGLDFTFAYQYFKHGDDQITLNNSLYNQSIANNARYLQEKTAHHLLLDGRCSIEKLCNRQWSVQPTVNCFFKLPFNGSNIVLTPMVGAGFQIMF